MRLLAAWDWHRFTRFDVWGVLFWVNVIALTALVIIATMVLVRDRVEKPAANLTPFYEDDDLETRRLERVLGWALVFSAVLAVSYGVYWLREPTRQSGSEDYFSRRAAERGEVLFANESMEGFDAATSLKCADCHGAPSEDPDLGKVVGSGGGTAPTIYTDATGREADSHAVSWKAPALNTILYRFSPDEVQDIITFGRPGSPMQPWGTDGGGPLNNQSVTDLVAYLASIQLSPEDAQKKAAADLEAAKGAADAQLARATEAVDTAKADLVAAETERDEIADQESDAYQLALRKVEANTESLKQANEALVWAQDWAARRAGITEGQLLFELNCARCHTRNWSIFDPSNPNLKPEDLLGPAGGGGNVGFNLENITTERFIDIVDADGNPDRGSGVLSQHQFVTAGSDNAQPYGTGGIGSGRMPGQCNTDTEDEIGLLEHRGCMLTAAQIEAIVAYERCGLKNTDEEFGAAQYDATDCE